MKMLKAKQITRIVHLSLLFTLLPAVGKTFAAPKLKPYQIKWYFVGNGQQRDVKLIEEAANKYLKNKINATIKLQCYTWGQEYNEKMQMIIASGEPFDICFTSSWANYYRQNVAKGAFVDITDLVKKYAPKTWAALHPSFIKGSAINGRNYAIPANKELAHQWGLIFNKKLVDKYNLDLTKIKKLSDIEPLLKVIKEKEPEVVPFQNVGTETAERILDFDLIGDTGTPSVLYNDSKDMKVFNFLEAPEMKDYLNTVRKFYLAGYIPKDAASPSYDWQTERRAGKAFCWVDSLKPFVAEERSILYGFPCSAVYLTKPIVQTRDCTGSMQAISKSSKDPARALMFLEIFNTDKYLNNLINFGIEGKHWVKKGPNVIDYPKGVTPQNSGYNPQTPWMFGNQYLNYLFPNENSQKWEAFQKFNEESTPAKSLGFNFDVEPVKNEAAALINVYNQYMPSLFTGAADPNVVMPVVIAKLKEAGLDKFLAEQQKQLDAWYKKTKKE